MQTTMTHTTETTTSARFSLVRALLHLEGAAVLLAAGIAYAHLHGSGLLFVLLLFVPDVAMLGYLLNARIGAAIYNLGHVYAAPGILLAVALALTWEIGVLVALIWFAHIGMDRALGYGFKYPTGFKDTHLQRL